MSYDVQLNDPVTGDVLHLDEPHQIKGGTYAVGGTTKAHLNVTYNYCGTLHRVLGEGGIRSLYGMSGATSISILKDAIAQLQDDVDDDYWKETDGNVKRALHGLLTLARMRPDGVWAGD